MAHNLASLQADLERWETALAELATNGQSYQITGSHSKTSVTPEQCERQIRRCTNAIFRLHGYSGTVTPDFSDGASVAGNIPEAV